jgi:hypothetical protein
MPNLSRAAQKVSGIFVPELPLMERKEAVYLSPSPGNRTEQSAARDF